MYKLSLFYIVLILGVTGINASQQYDDLVKLVKSGASEEVIVSYINASDYSYNLSSDEIVRLKEFGATSRVVIAAIQHKGSISANANAQAAPPETNSVAPPHPRVVYRVAYPWRPWRVARSYWYGPNVEKMNQALQIDMAGLMFGNLTLNYEYLLNRQHGLVLEGTYSTGWDSREGWYDGEDAELAYRWHWAKSMYSGFLGAFIKGGRFYGHEHDSPWDGDPKYTQTYITIGPDIGKRWVSAWGLSIVARIGYGYTWSKFTNPAPDQNTKDWLRWWSGLDSELSLGYAF